MLAIDPKLGTVFGNTDVIKLYFFFWSGLLPYLHIDREAALLPYMTRDYIVMRWNEIAEAKTYPEKVFLVLYIYLAQFANITLDSGIVHLQKRGIYTCYWTLNCPKELNHILKTSKIEGIMTDRIDDL